MNLKIRLVRGDKQDFGLDLRVSRQLTEEEQHALLEWLFGQLNRRGSPPGTDLIDLAPCPWPSLSVSDRVTMVTELSPSPYIAKVDVWECAAFGWERR